MHSLVLALVLLAGHPLAGANTPNKVFLTAPTEMTHPLGKFLIQPGLAYVWGTGKTSALAVGELAQDAEIAGIPLRKGLTLYLKNSSQVKSPEFEVVYPSNEELAGVVFKAGNRIRMGVTRYETLSRPDTVRLEGETARETTIDGATYPPGRVRIEALLNGPLFEKAIVLEGLVQSGTVPATTPILLAKGNRILRSGSEIKVENLSTAQEFGPYKLRGSSANFSLPSGSLVWIHLFESTRIETIELAHRVFFYPNGKPRIGLSSKEQLVNGIRTGRSENENFIDTGRITFHPNGRAGMVTSRFVDQNAAYLPNDFSILPSVLKPKEGVIAHFFNSRAEIAAVVLYAPQGPEDWVKAIGDRRYFEAKPVSGGLEFQPIPETEKKLRSLLDGSIQSALSKEVLEYLENGKLP